MNIKAVLFDLDGTLLPMDQDLFAGTYFKMLTERLASIGYDPKKFSKCLWMGVEAMVKNDGSSTNEVVFWKVFTDMFGEESMKDKPLVDEFYRVEFNQVQKVCGYHPLAKKIVEEVRKSGRKTVLATNPFFPPAATENRMRWAGLEPEDFDLYTTYDNSTYCKPNKKYYLEILEKIGCRPEECLMVGNDVDEDMIAAELGMNVFLITDCLINKSGKDISQYPNGNMEELSRFITLTR